MPPRLHRSGAARLAGVVNSTPDNRAEATENANPEADMLDEAFSPPAADLFVVSARVKNFRALSEATIPLGRTATYLVGENNSGKSSALLALATACGGRRASIDDLRQVPQGSSNETIIDLHVRSSGEEFSEALAQRLQENYGKGPGPGEWTGFRTTLSYSRESSFLLPRRTFLQWDSATEGWVDTGIPLGERVNQLIVGQLVGASRDLIEDLSARTSDWGRVLADLDVPPPEREALQIDLLELGRQLQEASPVLKNLAEQLRRVSEAQAGVGSIDLRPLPIRIEELARSVDIMVSSVTGNELPMRFQGLGMRSLAALMVFRAVCELRVGVDQGLRPHILTLLEEPEAHLHPQAQAAVRALVEDLPGQPVVATHSDVLIAATDPRNVRVFRVNETGTQIHSLTLDQAKKMAVFRRFVERPLGELFFARFVVFVDGTAERISLPSMLNGPLGRSCTSNGITVVDLEGMSQVQLQKAVEALSALGDIPWIVFLDNDADGWNAIKDLRGTDGVELSSGHSQVVVSGDKQLEALLLDSGFGDEVQTVANEFLPRTEDDPKFPELRLPDVYSDSTHDAYLKFLAKNKGWAAEHVVRRAIANGKSMPAPILDLAQRIKGVLGFTNASADDASSSESAK